MRLSISESLVFAQIRKSEVNLPNEDRGLSALNMAGALDIIAGIAGALCLVLIAYGGLKYVLSQGNPQETSKAKDTIINALIGLVITISAFGIINFVMNNL